MKRRGVVVCKEKNEDYCYSRSLQFFLGVLVILCVCGAGSAGEPHIEAAAHVYENQGRADAALEMLSRNEVEMAHNPFGVARIKHLKAHILSNEGRLLDALEEVEGAMRLDEGNNDYKAEACRLCFNIGNEDCAMQYAQMVPDHHIAKYVTEVLTTYKETCDSPIVAAATAAMHDGDTTRLSSSSLGEVKKKKREGVDSNNNGGGDVVVAIFDDLSSWHEHMPGSYARCPDVSCKVAYINQKHLWKHARAVIFHGPSNVRGCGPLRFEREFGRNYTVDGGVEGGGGRRLFLVLTAESNLRFPYQLFHSLQRRVDGYMSLDVEGKFPSLLTSSWIPRNMDVFHLQLNKRTDAVACAWISNCGQDARVRLNWLRGIMARINVHSYGRCENNMPTELDNKGDRMSEARIKLLGQYKFCLSFENVVDDGYVTEKMFQALVAGCVPVYFGTRDISGYLPHPNSIIYARDFHTPEGVVQHMQHLLAHEDEYNAKLAWKMQDKPVAFMQRLLRLSDETVLCRVCRSVASHKSHLKHRALDVTANAFGYCQGDATDVILLSTSQVTMETWVKILDCNAIAAPLLSVGSLSLGLECAGGIGFRTALIENGRIVHLGGNDLVPNEWHHIGVVVSSVDHVSLYHNGVTDSKSSRLHQIARAPRSGRIRIAMDERINQSELQPLSFHVHLDELRLWNGARTPGEMAEYGHRRCRGEESSSLVALYAPAYDAMSDPSFLFDWAKSSSSTSSKRGHSVTCERIGWAESGAPW